MLCVYTVNAIIIIVSYPAAQVSIVITAPPTVTSATEGSGSRFLLCLQLQGAVGTDATEDDVMVTLTVMSGGGKAGTCSCLQFIILILLQFYCIIFQYFRCAGYRSESNRNNLYSS